ncbi:peptidoglycan/LPS O-acetylase OafA/YrhL [Paenibacillus sp. PastF-3]|uniref:acyltransferase n=1 Tax=unclassified Paenibacillus TaxID=185978 RepID=UPI000BA05993|nr:MULTISPECIES: acyltransferase [unclassified Paenibacillus]MDH6370610.1 peptidoglycan/LPS O-acetylase OafA/YrhL [Paenibacillus sp. PastF-3]OZQ85522.1 acyltransferase [Paenibacillus sp. VTT E-133291]
MNTVRQERLPQLDIFRALAILGVLHVHASSFAAGEQALHSPYYYWLNWINIFFKFGTPSFIFLSSFVLFYNYYGRPVTCSLIINFYRRRLKYILLPYLLASMGYYALSLYVNGRLMQNFGDNLLSFSRALFSGSAYAHLYFVFISIQFYLLFPVLLKLMQSSRFLIKWAIPVGLALQWGFIFWNKYELHIVEKGSLAISYLAYYMMGAFIAIHFDKVKIWLMKPWREQSAAQKGWTTLLVSSWLIAAFIHVQLWYVARHFGVWTDSLWYELLWNVHTMLSALVLLYATFLLYRKAPHVIVASLTRLGELSFAIYLIHPLLLAIYRRFRYHIPLESLTYVFFIYGGLVVALGGSWFMVQFAFRRIPQSWIFLGSVPRSLESKSKVTSGHASEEMRKVNT